MRGHILQIRGACGIVGLSGSDTEVVEYHNSTLFTFNRTNTEGGCQYYSCGRNMKHHGHGDLQKDRGGSLPDVSRRCGNSEGIMKSINNK